MEEYLNNALYFVGAILLFVAFLFWWVLHKVQYNVADFKAYWTTDGAGAIPSLVKALVLIVGITFVVFLSNKALAEESTPPDWFQYTAVYAGLDFTKNQSPQCKDSEVDDKITSNIGVRQHIYSWGDVNLLGNYTHHSCAIGSDRNTYDGMGLQVEWRFNRF